jgi:hypothetical protein
VIKTGEIPIIKTVLKTELKRVLTADELLYAAKNYGGVTAVFYEVYDAQNIDYDGISGLLEDLRAIREVPFYFLTREETEIHAAAPSIAVSRLHEIISGEFVSAESDSGGEETPQKQE